MINVFEDTRDLDRRCVENYGLSEEIMMENAAAALEKEVVSYIESLNTVYINRPSVLILCGKGNNGADGYALARRLVCKKICVAVLEMGECKTEIGRIQADRCKKMGVTFINIMELDDYINEKSIDLKVVVDCIYGSGFHGSLDCESEAVLQSVNAVTDAYKVACDIPSGMKFCSDVTVTMGALKLPLFSDSAKDMCGRIVVADLGVSRGNFENAGSSSASGKVNAKALLLEKSDLCLPERNTHNVNKGSFGHAVVVAGEKAGAAILSSQAALEFGAGLVTLCNRNENSNINQFRISPELMLSKEVPSNISSVILGMGFGRENVSGMEAWFSFLSEHKEVSVVLDADAFYYPSINDFLKTRAGATGATVLTPHPKEFAELLKNTGLGEYSVEEVISKKVELIEKFCMQFPGIVLLVKGANVFVAVKNPSEENLRLYINTFGTQAMAKAGSGDVLSGIIGALLAQKWSGIKSAVSGTMAHALAASNAAKESAWYLTPEKIIQDLKSLC